MIWYNRQNIKVMLLKTKMKKRNLNGNKTINNLQKQNNKSPRVLFEIVFFEVWQFKYKSLCHIFDWRRWSMIQNSHLPSFLFEKMEKMEKMERAKKQTAFCDPSSAYIQPVIELWKAEQEMWNHFVNHHPHIYSQS